MRLSAAFLSVLLIASPANAGVLSLFTGGSATFTPVTRTYNTPGSGTETIPVGASQVVITVNGSGGGGSCSHNGGAGGRSIKTVSLSPSDWNASLVYGVGTSGSGGRIGGGSGADGLVNGSVSAGTIAMTSYGGGAGTGSNNGSNGVAGGGDTNITGGAANGGSAGSCDINLNGSPGGVGPVSFAYT